MSELIRFVVALHFDRDITLSAILEFTESNSAGKEFEIEAKPEKHR